MIHGLRVLETLELLGPCWARILIVIGYIGLSNRNGTTSLGLCLMHSGARILIVIGYASCASFGCVFPWFRLKHNVFSHFFLRTLFFLYFSNGFFVFIIICILAQGFSVKPYMSIITSHLVCFIICILVQRFSLKIHMSIITSCRTIDYTSHLVELSITLPASQPPSQPASQPASQPDHS